MGRQDTTGRITRRDLLQRSGGLAAGASLAALTGATGAVGSSVAGIGVRPAAAAAEGGFDYTSRATFDEFDRQFHDGERVGQPEHDNEAGALAWGQSYALMGFIRMYGAYGDPYYLDRLIHNADIMLTNRDSERGVTDFQGRSSPAWRAMNPYTAATVELPGADGRPTLEVRSGRAYAETSPVVVESEPDGRFTLTVTHTQGHVAHYEHLSMDPESPDYAPRRIYDEFALQPMVTARDRDTGQPPVAGGYELSSRPVVFAVHTGMITYPLASFARIVRRTPQLLRDRRYAAKAAEYVAAVTAALDVHEAEWQEDGPVGTYRWLKGTPLAYDGSALPVNHSTAMGRAWSELAAATGRPAHAERAAKLARMFVRQIEVDAGGAALWSYWPTFSVMWEGYAATGDPETDVSLYTPAYINANGEGARQLDDCSHAAISVDFAGLARQHGLVVTDRDMTRIARTFTQNMAITDPDGIATVTTRLDGTPGPAPEGQYLQAPRWVRAAWWDRGVAEHCEAIYAQRAPEPGFGSGLAAVASLNWFARAGHRPLPRIRNE